MLHGFLVAPQQKQISVDRHTIQYKHTERAKKKQIDKCPRSPHIPKALGWSGNCPSNAIHNHGSRTGKSTSSKRERHLNKACFLEKGPKAETDLPLLRPAACLTRTANLRNADSRPIWSAKATASSIMFPFSVRNSTTQFVKGRLGTHGGEREPREPKPPSKSSSYSCSHPCFHVLPNLRCPVSQHAASEPSFCSLPNESRFLVSEFVVSFRFPNLRPTPMQSFGSFVLPLRAFTTAKKPQGQKRLDVVLSSQNRQTAMIKQASRQARKPESQETRLTNNPTQIKKHNTSETRLPASASS